MTAPAAARAGTRTRAPAHPARARAALGEAVKRLASAGCETPRLDAEVLMAHTLGTTRERLLLDDPELDVGAAAVFEAALDRRARTREPVAYITGRRAFRHLELAVDARALIPRPETELLVEIGLELPAGASVLDVGTGCGAVALALKHERPDLRASASDVDERALALARANVRAHGIDVELIHADLLAGVPDEFDAVLANLPYVAECERGLLAPEIVDHEPPGALFAGPDGLSAIRSLVAQTADRQRLQLLALEVGATQAEAVAAIVREAGFANVNVEHDLAGISRAVVGKGKGNE
jgi:release factor glutamine methyltransferase